MGPGRSYSLRIGHDSLAVIDSGRVGNASSRSAVVEPRNVPGVPLLPLDKDKGKINLIKYPGGGGGGQITSNLLSNMLCLWDLAESVLRMGLPSLNVIDFPLVSGYGPLTS